MRRAQQMVLRTSRTPIAYLWALAYQLLARALGSWLRGRDRRVTVYARGGLGSRNVVYGLSDIDLAVIAPCDERRDGLARERVAARYDAMRRRLPWLCNTLFDVPVVLERDELPQVAAAPTITYGLGPAPLVSQPAAVYFGAHAHRYRITLLDRPGLRGPTAGWRRLLGPDVALPPLRRDRAQLRVAAWLELQLWWRWFLQACARPPTPDLPLLCAKMVAEPARIWLALAHDEYPSSRRDVLERVLRLLPEEEPALGRALWLEDALPHQPQPPLAEFLRYLVRFSSRIAAVLTDEVAAFGALRVRLNWNPNEELALSEGARSNIESLYEHPDHVRLIPLVDWRALTRAATRWQGRILSEPPDESLAPVTLDPCELGDLVAAVRAGNRGPYPALRAGAVLVLASIRWPRTQLRAVHFPATDPVSFALLAGQSSAVYPNVRGWSAADTAARAVAEHRAWIGHSDGVDPGGEELAMLISAARAALFEESIAEGCPELALTVAATLGALRARNPKLTLTLDEIQAGYATWRIDGTPPSGALMRAACGAVGSMRTYAGGY